MVVEEPKLATVVKHFHLFVSGLVTSSCVEPPPQEVLKAVTSSTRYHSHLLRALTQAPADFRSRPQQKHWIRLHTQQGSMTQTEKKMTSCFDVTTRNFRCKYNQDNEADGVLLSGIYDIYARRSAVRRDANGREGWTPATVWVVRFRRNRTQ